ncbi:MAG: hypothetical protein JWQ38_1485 [Flavipsychrobacter sp.]|nr:hypothetical protein [Flavipsychrobacter sp.]
MVQAEVTPIDHRVVYPEESEGHIPIAIGTIIRISLLRFPDERYG